MTPAVPRISALLGSILALAVPAARPRRPWSGVGLAWLVVFVAAIAVAVTNPNGWSMTATRAWSAPA